MKKSKIAETIKTVADKVLGDNYYEHQVGGSFNWKDNLGDLDIVLTIRKIKLDQIRLFRDLVEKETGLKVGLSVMTKLMSDREIYGSKTAMMLDQKRGNYTGEVIQRFLKDAIKGKLSKDKMIDLLIQELVLLEKDDH